jgi:hypothetical protein
VADERYTGGILAGISNSISLGFWPVEIPGLGPKVGGQPFGRCVDCGPDQHPMNAGSFVAYGGKTHCKTHATRKAATDQH